MGTTCGSGYLTLVATDINWQQLDVGTQHSCAIDAEEDLFCWGYELDGQLGTGNPAGAGTTQLEVAFVDEVATIAAGRPHRV